MSKLVAAIISPVARVFGPAAFVLFASIASAQVPTAPVPGSPAQLPPRDPQQQQQTGTAIIRGRVFAVDTGAPLRRAQVRLSAPTLREQRMTSTDTEGRYEFKELAAGRYNLAASKGSYVTMNYGQRRPFEPGKPLEIADGQTIEKVDFTLPRGGVVTGRVFDEYGDPVADASVRPMRYAFIQGRRQLVPTGRWATTNDIGEFRLYGLAPGDYYVSATLQNNTFGAQSEDRSGYAPTYYPGTPTVADAQKVTVTIGQAVSNINIALTVARMARVSGTVVDAQGKPANGGNVNLIQRSGAMMMGFAMASIRPDGTFTATNVPPGEYVLRAYFGSGMMVDPLAGSATQKVSVSGEDVEGVRLEVPRVAYATGRIVLDGAGPTSTIRASQFRISASPVERDLFGTGPQSTGEVHDDFTFAMKVLPCVCTVGAYAGQGTSWYLKSVSLDGADVTDTGIDFRSDQQVDGLEITLTNHPNELSGLVTDAKGAASKDYTLILFARDPERWKPGSRSIGTSRPDQDGRYKMRGMPAGDYYAIAVDYVEPGQWTDPDYLNRIQAGATAVTIGEGETKTLDLKLTTGS